MFETIQKQFFSYFWSQRKNQKKNFPEKISFFPKNQRFFSTFFTFDFSFLKSFPTPLKTDFSPKNWPNQGNAVGDGRSINAA